MSAVAAVRRPAVPTVGRRPRPLAHGLLLVAGVALVAALAGHDVRSTRGGQAAVDEPQYLLTALSLWHDHDLDISDELAGGQWRSFADEPLPQQTLPLADGRQVSPHDPLLALLLAAPVGLGGLAGAKAALALVSAATAALTVWTAVRRLAVPAAVAVPGAALAFASPPLVVYAQQVYPELPAALATLAAVAVLTGPALVAARSTAGAAASLAGVGLAVSALPWLGVKYAPVAAALAAVALWRLRHRTRRAAALAGGLVASGAAYLLVHRLAWGGWTVYAAGDQFADTGELSVVGVSPDYVGRSLRLVALLVDRGYGLAAWTPAWLLVVPAVGAGLGALLVRRRATGRPAEPLAAHADVLLLPLLAGWATATWAALTMHGFWWPGRQVVVVLPLALLLVLVLVARAPTTWRVAAAAMGLAGVATYAALVVSGLDGRTTWVTDRELVTGAPAFTWLQPLWPDYRVLSAPGSTPSSHSGELAGHLAWSLALGVALLVPVLRAARAGPPRAAELSPLTRPSPSEAPR